MLKYFRNRKVHVRYEYNNSLGGHRVREQSLSYDRFEIKGSWPYFQFSLFKDNVLIWEQEFEEGWEFDGLGELKYCNSGPYCYFTIKTLP